MRGNIYQLQTPGKMIYGRGSFARLGEVAHRLGSRALVISDRIMQDIGHVARCQQQLQTAGLESVVYAGVASEPTTAYVAAALQLLQRESCDLIVSLGGGSCLDTAKAVAVLATNPGTINEFVGAGRVAEQRAVPHIAIPTTAGTGSEATDVTVITDTEKDIKMMIKQPAFMPDCAIVDAALSMSLPPAITAATGIDALCHAIEAYISRKAQPLTDTFALAAIQLIITNLRTAFDNGRDVKAREAMSLAAMQAGIAFSNASVTLVHGMSRPVGALFHVPHGISNAMLLPAVLEYSQHACEERLADIAAVFPGCERHFTRAEAADFAVREVKSLCAYLKIPNLQSWGIPAADFEAALEKMARDAISSGSPGNNPKVPDESAIMALYRISYDYSFADGL